MKIGFFSRLILCVLSAALLIFSFPYANLIWLAWIALVPLLLVTDRVSAKGAFGYAYLTGFIFFLSVIFWIHHVTFLGLFLLTAYLSLYFGLFGLAVKILSSLGLWARLGVIPATWVVLECLREHALGGFGWASLGHSQATNTLLIQIVDITGVGGLSFLLVAFSVLVKEHIVSRGQKLMKASLVFLAILSLVLAYGAWRLRDVPKGQEKTVRVAVVQGNISLEESWSPRLKAVTVRKYLDLSREALRAKPDLIVWPETSFPHFTWDHPKLFDEVKALARESKTPVLLGAVTKEGDAYFNSALFVSPGGEVSDRYSKIHLVLFGEYIPFRKELPFLADIVPIDDFTAGQKWTKFKLKNGVSFSSLVCFEDTIPWLAQRFSAEGADFLVNITNDAWFKDSPQPVMHLYNALFRAVENRRALIRATNTGVSCLVDSRGVVGPCVEDSAGQRVLVSGIAVGDIALRTETTFYTKFGEFFTFLCFIGILSSLGILYLRKKEKIMDSTDVGASLSKKVLIIDDDRTVHAILKPALSSKGFAVVSAMTGEDGLRVAALEKPNMIILDVIMPNMKGREVCKKLKEDPSMKNIPVLFLTAKNSEEDMKAEMDMGAVGHITKPINASLLVQLIEKVLSA